MPFEIETCDYSVSQTEQAAIFYSQCIITIKHGRCVNYIHPIRIIEAYAANVRPFK